MVRKDEAVSNIVHYWSYIENSHSYDMRLEVNITDYGEVTKLREKRSCNVRDDQTISGTDKILTRPHLWCLNNRLKSKQSDQKI